MDNSGSSPCTPFFFASLKVRIRATSAKTLGHTRPVTVLSERERGRRVARAVVGRKHRFGAFQAGRMRAIRSAFGDGERVLRDPYGRVPPGDARRRVFPGGTRTARATNDEKRRTRIDRSAQTVLCITTGGSPGVWLGATFSRGVHVAQATNDVMETNDRVRLEATATRGRAPEVEPTVARFSESACVTRLLFFELATTGRVGRARRQWGRIRVL